jgi:sugar transferase (PEP-CTERM/EpsH1 system associated)
VSHVGRPLSPRPTIVHVVHSLAVGGLENGLVNLVNATADDFRHVVVCMTKSGPFRDRLRADVEVFALDKREGHDPRALLRLVTLLRRVRPAIAHSRNWATFDAVLAATVARVPRVVHGEHGRDIADPHGTNGRRRRIRRLLSPLVDKFVTVSLDLRRWLVEEINVPARKVVTIHNGVDVGTFCRRDRELARAELGLSVDGPVIGTVGRLDPVKDQVGLVEAFAILADRHSDASLVIVGDGPCREALQERIERLGLGKRAILLGERRDVPVLLSGMDLFVLPSIAEGVSNTVLEAMAIGLPVVATKVGGNAELVADGVTGRLVPARDTSQLAEAMEWYLDAPDVRARHGQAAHARAREQFSLASMARSYRALYTDLLPNRSTVRA